MTNYESAIKRPFQDVKKLIIGCFLNIIPLVNLISTGYILKAAKNTLNKKNELPEWEDWGNLFITGLTAAIIGLIYALPGLIVIFAAVGSIVFGMIMGPAGALDVASIIASGGVLFVIALIWIIVAAFIAPMAVIRYVDKGEFSAAFAFGEIIKKIFTGEYVGAWLIMIIYGLIVTAVLSMVPIAGPAIAGFVTAISSTTVFAEVYTGKK